jgi:hypothetical protein
VNPDSKPDPDPVFDDQKFKTIYSKKTIDFFLPYFYSSASLKGFQATGEVSSLQNSASSFSKHKNFFTFSVFVGYFCLLGSTVTDPTEWDSIRIRIRIRNTAQNPLEVYI